jgi:hypothetical protein
MMPALLGLGLVELVVGLVGSMRAKPSARAFGVMAMAAVLVFALLPAPQALATCNAVDTDQTCTNSPADTTLSVGGSIGIEDNNTLTLTNFRHRRGY